MLRTVALSLFTTLLLAPPALAEDRTERPLDQPMMLVATPRLIDPLFAHTVLLVVPMKNDQHIGFIINRPTDQKLSNLFPDHEASKKATDPVYFGGPMAMGTIFALVRGDHPPGPGAIPVLQNLHIVIHVDEIDRIIERAPGDARYLIGLVQWQAGELRQELAQGAWNIQKASGEAVFRKNPKGLWDELSMRSRAVLARASAGDLLRVG